jgi:hypothetical protein
LKGRTQDAIDEFHASARDYAEAFAETPKLAEELLAEHRYNAACVAALAGCGEGRDAEKLDDRERARLRRQSQQWLRAELAAWKRQFDKRPDQVRSLLARRLKHWLEDTDFTGVRGPEALARLPEAERQAWQELWRDIAGTLAQVQAKPAPEKKKAK